MWSFARYRRGDDVMSRIPATAAVAKPLSSLTRILRSSICLCLLLESCAFPANVISAASFCVYASTFDYGYDRAARRYALQDSLSVVYQSQRPPCLEFMRRARWREVFRMNKRSPASPHDETEYSPPSATLPPLTSQQSGERSPA